MTDELVQRTQSELVEKNIAHYEQLLRLAETEHLTPENENLLNNTIAISRYQLELLGKYRVRHKL